MNVDDSAQPARQYEFKDAISQMTFGKDADELWIASSASVVVRLDLKSQEQARWPVSDLEGIRCLEVSPDGSQILLAGTEKASFWNLNPATGEAVELPAPPAGN